MAGRHGGLAAEWPRPVTAGNRLTSRSDSTSVRAPADRIATSGRFLSAERIGSRRRPVLRAPAPLPESHPSRTQGHSCQRNASTSVRWSSSSSWPPPTDQEDVLPLGRHVSPAVTRSDSASIPRRRHSSSIIRRSFSACVVAPFVTSKLHARPPSSISSRASFARYNSSWSTLPASSRYVSVSA